MNGPALPQQLARTDRDRMKRYAGSLAFYNGAQWPARATRGEKHLTFNYAKAIVDKTTSYLMSGMGFTVDPVEDGDDARQRAVAAEAALHQVYRDNNLEALDFDTETDCAVLGDAAYKVTWDVADGRVRVTAPDVQGLYAWWLPDDVGTVYRVASRYQLSADEVELLHGSRPSGRTAWVAEVWTDRAFELWLDDECITTAPNPYGFIPFVIFPNLCQPKRFWGVSDIPVLMEAQRELNRALSQLSRILELSGNPIAVLENVESSQDIAVQPGAVWNIPEEARAYLLDLLQGGGVRLHIDYIDLLYRTLHDISESPRAAFGTAGRDLSGVALEIEMQPLLQKVARKRLVRTAAYRRRNEMVLALIERFTGERFGRLSHRIVWGPVLPRDREREAATEVALIQSGVHSRRRAMEYLGVDSPGLEFDAWLEERKRILQMNRDLNARQSGAEGG
ncbi:MAG: phage portal protein [Chloroflexota bacterium]|nr:phage portal protein [Chloroflexota bacterium]